jgi:translation initiation factor IF-3
MIKIPEVRVIDEEGEQLGVMATAEALRIAEDRGLDLVEISPTAKPPVCRVMDYGKFKYERNKKLKESKKKQHVIQIKEIKLRPKTEEHDYQFKKRHAEDFLKKAHKVKFTIIFRGRELDHKDLGFKMLKRIEEDLADVGEVERPARFEGRFMVMFMKPLSSKPVGKTPKQPEESQPEQKEEKDAEN